MEYTMRIVETTEIESEPTSGNKIQKREWRVRQARCR